MSTPVEIKRAIDWRKAHPERTRELNRESWHRTGYFTKAQRVYGLSKQDVLAMRAAQDNRCAICRRPETIVVRGLPRPLHIDHDHDTGVVRGLLCSGCNTGLGKFGDDPAVLRQAAAYLEG